MKSFLRPLIEYGVGKNHFDEGVEVVFSALQNPTINKQLAFVLLDTSVAELFPEVMDGKQS